MSDPVRFGLVGSGNVARLHGRALAATRAAKLVAVGGRNAAATTALAGELGVAAALDVDDLLARKDVDAVVVCTPSGTHAELGLRAARAGKHVLVEKPIDVSWERARALVAGCREARVRLGVVFQNRFLAPVTLVRRAIEAGRLGRVLLANGYVKWFRGHGYYKDAPWRGTRALDGGGALMNQAIHTVDLIHHLAGPVAAVSGFTARLRHDIECEDTAVASLRLASGGLGTLEATTSVWPGFARRLELHGEKGSVVVDGDDVPVWSLEGSGPEEDELKALRAAAKERKAGGENDPMAIDLSPHRAQLEDFACAIRDDRAPAVDGDEGMRALEIVLAVYQSAEDKRVVELRG